MAKCNQLTPLPSKGLRATTGVLSLLGTTPQRREFEFPRVLSKTSAHEKIVEEFRRNYIEQEAVATALPGGDDMDEDTVRPSLVCINSKL